MLRISLFFLAFAPLLQAQQPNIVIFFSDDHTNQAISAYQDLPDAAPQDALVASSWPAILIIFRQILHSARLETP
jgi:hypothetical protein